MCGIIAIAGSSQKLEVQKTLESISHRGPDGLRAWTDYARGIFLGHARLSIIDLTTGDQPMHDTSAATTIVFNGEIYNYRELKDDLAKKGHSFTTTSDTEVILKGYQEYGSEIVSKLNGMFAFALYDSRKDELFFARDPIGIKPLYYSLISSGSEQTLVLCSELRATAKLVPGELRFSEKGFIEYLFQGYTLAPTTILENVYQVPHGHLGTWSKTKGLQLTRYFDLAEDIHKQERHSQRFDESVHEFNTLFEKVIQRQMIADVAVGSFLSGGIDSSLVTSFAKESYPGELQTFTADFDQKEYSEALLARKISGLLDTKHTEFKLDPNSVQERYSDLAYLSDAPIFDNSFIPLEGLCAETKKHVKVVLSGDGGDEAFLGYDTYRADRFKSKMDILPQFSKELLSSFASFVPVKFGKVTTQYKIGAFLRSFHHSTASAHAAWRSLSSETTLRSLLQPGIRDRYQAHHPQHHYESLYKKIDGQDLLTSMSYLDFETWLPNDILVKSDRASMSHGLEVRVPLLDIELVKFAMSLRDSTKFYRGDSKAILKTALKQKMPEYPIHEKKKGFNAPMSEWICTLLRPAVESFLHSNSPLFQWIDRNALRETAEQHFARKQDQGYLLWSLLTLHEWFQGLNRTLRAH